MTAFFVGQRVRFVKRTGLPTPTGAMHPRRNELRVGDEARVLGTDSCPNAGFIHADYPVLSVEFLVSGVSGIAPAMAFEPIVPKGMQPAEWSECLWRPEGVEA